MHAISGPLFSLLNTERWGQMSVLVPDKPISVDSLCAAGKAAGNNAV